MIGFYNYTVLLTYLSLISAGLGIVVSLSGGGHPYIGVFFLLISGLCDAFDGKVARTKADRSEMEQKFGIQIDSLSDIVAFGVLPACIGAAMLRCSPTVSAFVEAQGHSVTFKVMQCVAFALLILYMLAAMIRLAYFNVTEEERQKAEGGARKFYTGLPVTSAALIFPTVLLIQYLTPKMDVTPFYFAAMLFTGLAFLMKFQLRKPGLRGILIMVAIGAAEFIAMAVLRNGLRLR